MSDVDNLPEEEDEGKKKGGKNADTFAGDSEDIVTELMERPKEYSVNFEFPETTDLRPPILSVEGVSFRYNEDCPWLFKGSEFGLDLTSRVSIVGPNGVGKSTLLNLICGDLEPVSSV